MSRSKHKRRHASRLGLVGAVGVVDGVGVVLGG